MASEAKLRKKNKKQRNNEEKGSDQTNVNVWLTY